MRTGEDTRPSPEALLKVARAESADEEQAKLKIFLGYAAGVGKTYAMLEAALQRKRDGRDVVVACLASHGRNESDLPLEGLEIVPHAKISNPNGILPELDLDAVLARRPQIALVDELAHSNVPDSRHRKRWQDVEELLAAGIDVYTTANIQHFQSLSDVVAQITGVTVHETVPDRLLDLAAEIRLVDLPPEDLLQRLHEGKIYIPEKDALATDRYFKLGNLMALRELSLRRAAARVDDQMRAYMESRCIAGPWPVAEKLLVCVSGSPFSERLIHTTKRLADETKAVWHTVYIETPGVNRYARENRERVWRDMRLAESLGAQVATLTSISVAEALIDYAVKNNITKIVVGKPTKPRWREVLRQPLVDKIIRQSGSIDVHVVSITKEQKDKSKGAPPPGRPTLWAGYLQSLALVLVTSLVCEPAHRYLSPTNLVMIYLLAVVLAATRLGRRPAVLTAFLSVLAFDFFFVTPRFTFAASDPASLLTFVALFTVGVVISTLVSQSSERAEAIREREVQTASLYYLSRDLAVASDLPGIMDAMVRNIEESLGAQIAVFMPEGERFEMKQASSELSLGVKELAVADWAFKNRSPAGRGTDTLVSAALLYLPIATNGDLHGILGVKLADETGYTSPLSRRLLQAFATQAALAIERVRLGKQAEQAQILLARESLERALLNSISHDLRTPLVSITGALGALRDEDNSFDRQARAELIDGAWEEAGRLNRFVGNLLDMTRLESGALRLKLVPCDVQDLFGCALAALEPRLDGREIEVLLPSSLDLVRMDMVLMMQVVVNLLDNALKYTPRESCIELAAGLAGQTLTLTVADRGPGIPEKDLKRVFDKFYRLPVPEGAGGTGLGLSICKGIVEAHSGNIRAENRDGGGLRMIVALPLT
jgi:two-component system, OmpR family, sensor histidine kinase KdpD